MFEWFTNARREGRDAEFTKNTEIAIFLMLYVALAPFICICVAVYLRNFCATKKDKLPLFVFKQLIFNPQINSQQAPIVPQAPIASHFPLVPQQIPYVPPNPPKGSLQSHERLTLSFSNLLAASLPPLSSPQTSA